MTEVQTFTITFLYPRGKNILSVPIRGATEATAIKDIYNLINNDYNLDSKFDLVSTCGGSSQQKIMKLDKTVGDYLSRLPMLYVVRMHSEISMENDEVAIAAASSNQPIQSDPDEQVRSDSNQVDPNEPTETPVMMAPADQQQHADEQAAEAKIHALIKGRQHHMRLAMPKLGSGELMMTADSKYANAFFKIQTDSAVAGLIKGLQCDERYYKGDKNIRTFTMKLNSKVYQLFFVISAKRLPEPHLYIVSELPANPKVGRKYVSWSSLNFAARRNISVLVEECIKMLV